MSAYLTLVKEGVDVFSLSRNDEAATEILENYDIVFDGETRLDNIDFAVNSIGERIRRMEILVNGMLIKRDFDERNFADNTEYLIELYEIRGKLYFINYIITDSKFMGEKVFFRYG